MRVRRVRKFIGFKEMIENVGVKALLPDHDGGTASAVEVYKSFGTTRGSYAELEEEYGAVAMDIEPLVRHASRASNRRRRLITHTGLFSEMSF